MITLQQQRLADTMANVGGIPSVPHPACSPQHNNFLPTHACFLAAHMAMQHLYTITKPTTGSWLLAALKQPKAEASVLTQLLVSSLLASYRGSTKLCLYLSSVFSLFALIAPLHMSHMVCFAKPSVTSSIMCTNISIAEFEASALVVHAAMRTPVSLFSLVLMDVFEASSDEMKDSFRRSCSGFLCHTGQSGRSKGPHRSEQTVGGRALRVRIELCDSYRQNN